MRIEIDADGSVVIDDGVTVAATTATQPTEVDWARPTAQYRDSLTAAALALHQSARPVSGTAGPAFGLQAGAQVKTPSERFDWRIGEGAPTPVQAGADIDNY